MYFFDYTTPLNKLIKESVDEAEWYIYYPDFNGIAAFYFNVNHGGRWDVKRRDVWKKTIPEVHYYSQVFKFVFNGTVMDSENFGNFFYGCTGHATGFSLKMLYKGSAHAANTSNTEDTQDDLDFIKMGFEYYEQIS